MHNAAERNPLRKLFPILLFFFLISQAEADQTIIDRELTVVRGDYKEVHYLIPDNSAPSKLRGSFTCRGGMNDDVNFLILTKDQYVRWYSHYSHKPILRLEKKKEGKFEIDARPGETYYFVFDNFISSVSNKQVKLQVKLVSKE
jgi:hypothetical protein